MFIKEYNLRYSDLDSHIQVKISSVIDILQDISIEHSAQRGFSLKKLYGMSIAWLLQGWRIRFLEPLDGTKSLTAKTGIMRIRQFEAVRKYELWQEGRCKVIATASWFTVDTRRLKVIVVPDELKEGYENVQEADNDLPFIKLRPVKSLPVLAQTKVEKRDVDTNNHMNNVKSVEVALELLPEAFSVSELQITYRKTLPPGECIKMCGEATKTGFSAVLLNGADQPCVLVAVKQNKKM